MWDGKCITNLVLDKLFLEKLFDYQQNTSTKYILVLGYALKRTRLTANAIILKILQINCVNGFYGYFCHTNPNLT